MEGPLGQSAKVECIVCGRWPTALRPVMRSAIDAIPLRQDVCDECVKAWWAGKPKGPTAEGRGQRG